MTSLAGGNDILAGKAMVALMRKLVKLIYGLARSGAGYDERRVQLKDVQATMIYLHVMNKPGLTVKIPADVISES